MEVKKKGSITAFMLPFFILLYFMPLINLSNIENAKSGYTDQDFPWPNPIFFTIKMADSDTSCQFFSLVVVSEDVFTGVVIFPHKRHFGK